MDSLALHLVVLISLFVGNVLFGCLPSAIGRAAGFYGSSDEESNRRSRWTSFLVHIGTGVFISNSLIVLLPQADHEFESHENHSHGDNCVPLLHSPPKEPTGHHHDSFPIPEFTVLCGFFLAFVMQEAACLILSKSGRNSREVSGMQVRFCSCAKRHTECSRTFKDVKPDQTLFGLQKKLMESGRDQSMDCDASNMLPEAEVLPDSELLRSSILSQSVPNYGAVTNVTEPPVDAPLPVLTAPTLLDEVTRQTAAARDQNKLLINSMLIVIELSLQYIFLGIHLGLRTGSTRGWTYLTLSCLQIFLLTFAAGSYLAVGSMEFSYVGLFIGLLSMVSPIGMIAAMVEKSSMESIPHLAKGITLSVACGALIYTTFYELLRQKGGVTGLTKFIAISLGASIYTLLQYGILAV